MRLGTILLWEDDLELYRSRLTLATRLGYEVIGVGDSPGGYRDLAVSMTVAAQTAPAATVASAVTVPVGRHPALVAGMLSTLQQLSGDRVVCGIGTGGSATAAMGMHQVGLAQVRRFVVALRDLLDGRGTTWDGLQVPPLRHPRPTPIFLSAYGPATRRLAGELFDGVILATGSDTELLDRYLGDLAEGAARAGRDPQSVRRWVMTRASVRPNRDDALVDIKANLASAASFGLRSPAQMETIPEAIRPRIVELQERYDATQHVVWDGPNAKLLDELELTGYLAGRFAVAGTPDQCRAQIADLESRGIEALVIPAVERDPEGLMQRFADAALRA